MNYIHIGDCLETLRAWADMGLQAQMCVTSPPYFGLRDYGHAGQIGLEETPEQFIAKLVEVFREVRRVLREDGTLWVNMGDSYASSSKGSGGTGKSTLMMDGREEAQRLKTADASNARAKFSEVRNFDLNAAGLKSKDLIGVPWMLAFALRADGWYLRQDIVWAKPNPMPESVTDRCTKSHEYIFLLSKSPRYFIDPEGLKEPAVGGTPGNKGPTKGGRAYINGVNEHRTSANLHAVGARETRNKRSVWTVATRPYKGAHFATFPPALIEPCILAGSRPGDVVLDPFMGSGTTAQVALQHGRQYLGCELNPEYEQLQQQRLAA